MKDYKQIESLTLEECESYLMDPNLSQIERQYAEQHREEMMKWPWKKSIMEEFPEYRFRPISLIRGADRSPSKGMYVAGITMLSIAFVVFAVSIILGFTIDVELFAISSGGFYFLTFGIACLITSKRAKNGHALNEVADYISIKWYGRKYLIFVKNRKFGVLTDFNMIQIPAEYDKLSWKEKNRILVAEKNGETFLIDIFGNRLS